MNKHPLVVHLNEVEHASLVLKANLMGETVEQVAYQAINHIPLHIDEDRECFWCREKGNLKIAHENSYTHYNVAGKMHKIILYNYPVLKCCECERVIEDVEVECDIDRIIDLEVKKSLKTSKRVPTTIELDNMQ